MEVPCKRAKFLLLGVKCTSLTRQQGDEFQLSRLALGFIALDICCLLEKNFWKSCLFCLVYFAFFKTSDDEHLFMFNLLSLCLSSWSICWTLAQFCFYNILFVSLLIIDNSLYILDTSLLSDICFTNIFSKSLFHLFIFVNTIIWKADILSF